MGTGESVIGYVRVSIEEQGESGAGLEAQRRAIRAECRRCGWRLVRIERGRSYRGRRGHPHPLAGARAMGPLPAGPTARGLDPFTARREWRGQPRRCP
jgi:hypothetical protein